MNIGPFLLSAEYRDDTAIYSMVRKNVYTQIKPHAWLIPAHCRRPNDNGREFRALISQQDGFAETFIFVVIRERNEGMFLGDVGVVADTVNGTSGSIDEAADAR